MLPNVATLPITVGVGAFLVRERGLLVVRKTYGPSKGQWTIPSGYVERHESIVQSVEREVKEETNIVGRTGSLPADRNRVTETANDTFLVFRPADVPGPPEPDHGGGSEAAFVPLEEALDRLFPATARPRNQPVSMAVADIPEIFRFGEPTPIAQAFCAKNLPGPFTVVLRATAQAPRPMVSRDGRIAVRIPGHPIPRLLAKAIGPITSTSANRHGQPVPRTCEAAREQLGDHVDLYIDGGATPLGGESSVVDLSGKQAKILRQGTSPLGA